MLASQDFPALEAAMPLLFDRAAGAGPPGTREQGTGNSAGIPEALLPWLAHLCELDAIADLAPAAGLTLSFAEIKGLALLRRARQKFLAEHEQCSVCLSIKRTGSFCPRGCRRE